MTQSREFNGATVEEALERAAAALGVSAGEVSYEVVDAGSDGFLGIGARDARILVEVTWTDLPYAEEAPAEEAPAEEGFEEPADTEAPASVELSEVLGESPDAENVA